MPLTIDHFSSPPFGVLTALPGQTKTLPLPPPPPAPPPPPKISFSASAIPSMNYDQPSTLDVREGILIVNSGFGITTSGQVHYGKQLSAATPPLVGLTTTLFPAGLQLNLLDLSADIELSVILVVQLPSGQQYDNGPVKALPTINAFTMKFPWANFVAGGSKLPLPSDIVGVSIIWETIRNATFGITSLQAMP